MWNRWGCGGVFFLIAFRSCHISLLLSWWICLCALREFFFLCVAACLCVCGVCVHLHVSLCGWKCPVYCYSTSRCVFSLHRRRFMHCLQDHCVSKQECWCQCTLSLSSCCFIPPSSLVLWLTSVLIKGMWGTVCNKAISTLPIMSSFIRLQKSAERKHTHIE